ncbi:MAG: ankyrin repeat domain-containing protein, partial [Gammaproteobacteria bacterium]|nr:ankyrin repeat domain-containing protein [Gammaproteobacteria bacterium]
KLLLEAGADVTDGPTLWEGCAMWEALQLADATSLKLLLEAGSPHYQKCHALAYSLHAERPALTALLLEYEADPNWNKTAWCFGGTAMHEALMLGRSIECIEMLTAAGANVESTDRDGRTPLAVATRTGNQEACALLQRAGANAESVTDVDRWIAACLREDGNAAAQLRAKVDTAAHRLRHSDHQWVPRAIRRGTPGAVKYLLEGGASPNVPDDDGQYALHLAAEMADHAVCEVLLRAGANVDARNFDGDTALALACEVDDELSPKKTIDALRSAGADINTMSGAWSAKTPTAADCNEKFERAADAIAAGDADTLRALLEEEPALTMARSSRRHRATLLHYIGANGVEQHRQHTPTNAVEIATLLLEAGSDPNALCLTYRGGPDATTLGLLTSSSHPREAGLTLDLVRVLGNYGAELGPVYRLLITLTAPSHDVPIDSAIDASTLAEGLLEAVRLGNADLVTALLERNANVNAAPRDGVTALHEAALSGNEELLDLLLENGADRELRDQLFNSPAAGWAQAGGHIALAKKLGAAGH